MSFVASLPAPGGRPRHSLEDFDFVSGAPVTAQPSFGAGDSHTPRHLKPGEATSSFPRDQIAADIGHNAVVSTTLEPSDPWGGNWLADAYVYADTPPKGNPVDEQKRELQQKFDTDGGKVDAWRGQKPRTTIR